MSTGLTPSFHKLSSFKNSSAGDGFDSEGEEGRDISTIPSPFLKMGDLAVATQYLKVAKQYRRGRKRFQAKLKMGLAALQELHFERTHQHQERRE